MSNQQSDIKAQVGETAGKVWQELSSAGPQTLAQLKKKFNGDSELLNLAVGWLARENKVDITPEKKTLRVQVRGA
ncbi:MAG: hypothetical protein DMG25_16125 [Acidobacteria bacterium]|nr:MAG: hypothetical protein DMG25_16125 [Acidobacteriota bacterium]PYV27298.1 MAG: hypothetical protein DMG27_04395 [Acidobacteriota bacterium]